MTCDVAVLQDGKDIISQPHIEPVDCPLPTFDSTQMVCCGREYYSEYIWYLQTYIWHYMWQSRIEIEYYSVAYFECITKFDAL